MELITATPVQLRTVYETLLRPSFPPAELKPLSSMEEMTADGGYDPLLLVENGEILGTCFLWFGVPGWAVLDYLCVCPKQRSGGHGAVILRLMREAYPSWVILAESEAPAFAPDPPLAERRLGFYDRNAARLAPYDTEAFGVRYKTLYWADAPMDTADLICQHRFIYESRFGAEKYAKFVRIPCPEGAALMAQVPWDE